MENLFYRSCLSTTHTAQMYTIKRLQQQLLSFEIIQSRCEKIPKRWLVLSNLVAGVGTQWTVKVIIFRKRCDPQSNGTLGGGSAAPGVSWVERTFLGCWALECGGDHRSIRQYVWSVCDNDLVNIRCLEMNARTHKHVLHRRTETR